MILRYGLAFLSMACWPIVHVGAEAQSSSASDLNGAVYYNEDGIMPPELTPTDFSSVIVPKNCEYARAGIVRISLVVHPQGRSEKVAPLYPFNDEIDKAAVSIAEVDRFLPGAKDGVPVAVAQELEIKLTVCRIKFVDRDGTTSARLRLESAPVQRLFPAPKKPLPSLLPFVNLGPATPELAKQYGKLKALTPGLSAPVPLVTPEAEYPPEQRSRGIEGSCVVNLVVDAKGQPQAMRVVRGTNEQFDAKALEAVAKYRFRPAKKGNDPVSVMMSIEVNFRRP